MSENVMQVEPCCYKTEISAIWGNMPKSGTEVFFTNSETQLSEFLGQMVWWLPGSEVTIALVHIEDSTLDMLHSLLGRMAVMDDGKSDWLIRKLNIIVQPRKSRERIEKYLAHHARYSVVTIAERDIAIRCLCIGNEKGNLLLTGSLNQSRSRSSEMLLLSRDTNLYERSMRKLHAFCRVKAPSGI